MTTTLTRLGQLVLLILTATALSGCAIGALDQGSGDSIVTAAGPDRARGTGAAYVLSSDEKEYDCKQLTGRMQIRILELRSANPALATSGLSRTLQGASTAVFGGTKAGLDPTGEHARDLAMLEAYNRELAAKDCRSYDLDAALTGSDTLPAPGVAPRAKAASAN